MCLAFVRIASTCLVIGALLADCSGTKNSLPSPGQTLTAAACSVTPAPPQMPLPSPTPIDAKHVAIQFRIDPSAQLGQPCINPNEVNIYVFGTDVTTGAYAYVSNANGDTTPASASTTIPPINFCKSGVSCGSVSQVIQLPQLNSARVYMSVRSPLTITPASPPAPWTSASFDPVFDWFEYTMPANGLPSPSIVVNSTQIQMIGLDYVLLLNGQGTSTSGLLPGFMTYVQQHSPGPPWSTVMYAQPNRILGPNAVQFSPGGNCSLIGFVTPGCIFPPMAAPPSGQGGQFLDGSIQTAWDRWKSTSPTCMTVNTGTMTVYGQVDANENFNFYNVGSCAGIASATPTQLVATLQSPFEPTYQTYDNLFTGCGNTSTTWFTATSAELLQNGPFAAATQLIICTPNAGYTAGTQSTIPFSQNGPPGQPTNAVPATVGNIISTALNRGLLSTSSDSNQPECPGLMSVYQNSVKYTNQYAATLWKAVQAGYTPKVSGIQTGVYAIPYDDQCAYSSTLQDRNAQSIIVTINGN